MSPFDEMSPEERLRAAGGTTETHRPPPGRLIGRLRVFSASEIIATPARDYLLKGLMSPSEMSVLVGAPKSGKTFWATHVGYGIAQGREYVVGRRVRQAPVLYVAAEGEAGIAARLRALQREYGTCNEFHLIAQPADLLHCDANSGDLRDLIKIVQMIGARVVFLDTLSRLFSGGDENAPGDMGRFIANVTELRYATNAHIVIVHHGTKSSNGTVPRGHGSLIGAADLVMEVAKGEDGSRTVTVTAAKDDPDGSALGFTLRVVDLGTDKDGDMISTCVVEEHDHPAVAKTSLSATERNARDFLTNLIATEGKPLPSGPDFPLGLCGVCEGRWREECESRRLSTAETRDSRSKAFRRAYAALLDARVIATRDGIVWLIRPT